MEIKRDLYLNKLIRREHNGLIKIVTGIRRCGKSYLLFNLFHQYLLNKGIKEDHIIEVALDNIKHSELRKPKPMMTYTISFLMKYSCLMTLLMSLTDFCILKMLMSTLQAAILSSYPAM